MYKYSKDFINIEKAEKYNSYSNSSRKEINPSCNVNSVSKSNNKQNAEDMSSDYYSLLDNKAILKETCKSFQADNGYRQHTINYTSPEILLQEAFLNSQFALGPIISRKSEDDE